MHGCMEPAPEKMALAVVRLSDARFPAQASGGKRLENSGDTPRRRPLMAAVAASATRGDAHGLTTAGGLRLQVRRRRYFETPQDIKKRKEADKHARKRSERRQAAARARNTN